MPSSNCNSKQIGKNSESSLNSDYFHGSSNINISSKTKLYKPIGN